MFMRNITLFLFWWSLFFFISTSSADNEINLDIDENKLKKGFIILVDDVINSGKTMQYALVKFLERPTKTIRTVVLVDRKHRRYPVKADIVGLSLSTTLKDRVEVVFNSKASKAYLI